MLILIVIILTFSQGDIIALVGPTNNGWSFGLNMQTKRTGWFPSAYAQEISDDIMNLANMSNQTTPSPGQQQESSPVQQQQQSTPQQQQQQQQVQMNGSEG